MRSQMMRLFFVCSVLVFIAGCGENLAGPSPVETPAPAPKPEPTPTPSPAPTPTPAPAPPVFVNLNFRVTDSCTSQMVSGANVHLDKNFGNGQDRVTDSVGFTNFGVLSGEVINWSVTANQFSTQSGSITTKDSDVTVELRLNRHMCPPPPPEISFTFVPAVGSFADLRGLVLFADPLKHKVVVYIRVGGWWTKPYWALPLTDIRPDGTWTCDVTTGGIDERASAYAAFLVTNDHVPVLASGRSSNLPISVNGRDVLDLVTVNR